VSVASVPFWRRRHSPPPAPPHVKRGIVADYVNRVRPSIFVETGTYRGDTLARVRPLVNRAISIELDPTLAKAAQRRFKRWPNVEIRIGDSALVLAEVVAGLTQPSLFWLDGHYSGGVTANSGESPVMKELSSILLSSGEHTVLIDDARLFDGTDGYPTIGEITAMISSHDSRLTCSVVDDIIRVER